jgi:hypothetical protein
MREIQTKNMNIELGIFENLRESLTKFQNETHR